MQANYGIQPSDALFHAEASRRHLATPDGLVVRDTGAIELAEIKTTNKGWRSIPRNYLRQVWWQQYVLGAERTLLVWEQHEDFVPIGSEPECRWIDRDENEIAILVAPRRPAARHAHADALSPDCPGHEASARIRSCASRSVRTASSRIAALDDEREAVRREPRDRHRHAGELEPRPEIDGDMDEREQTADARDHRDRDAAHQRETGHARPAARERDLEHRVAGGGEAEHGEHSVDEVLRGRTRIDERDRAGRRAGDLRRDREADAGETDA